VDPCNVDALRAASAATLRQRAGSRWRVRLALEPALQAPRDPRARPARGRRASRCFQVLEDGEESLAAGIVLTTPVKATRTRPGAAARRRQPRAGRASPPRQEEHARCGEAEEERRVVGRAHDPSSGARHEQRRAACVVVPPARRARASASAKSATHPQAEDPAGQTGSRAAGRPHAVLLLLRRTGGSSCRAGDARPAGAAGVSLLRLAASRWPSRASSRPIQPPGTLLRLRGPEAGADARLPRAGRALGSRGSLQRGLERQTKTRSAGLRAAEGRRARRPRAHRHAGGPPGPPAARSDELDSASGLPELHQRSRPGCSSRTPTSSPVPKARATCSRASRPSTIAGR